MNVRKREMWIYHETVSKGLDAAVNEGGGGELEVPKVAGENPGRHGHDIYSSPCKRTRQGQPVATGASALSELRERCVDETASLPWTIPSRAHRSPLCDHLMIDPITKSVAVAAVAFLRIGANVFEGPDRGVIS